LTARTCSQDFGNACRVKVYGWWGPRRTGKTSVMQRLQDKPRNGCRVVYIDCQAMNRPDQFVSALAEQLNVSQRDDVVRGLLVRIKELEIGLSKAGVNWPTMIGATLPRMSVRSSRRP